MRKFYLSSLLVIACLAMQPTAQAGFWTATYTVTGTSSTGDTPPPTDPNFEVSVTGQPSGFLSASMSVQATLHWNPSFAGDNPPPQITVKEWVSESATDSGDANSLSILFSNPLGDPVVNGTTTPTFISKTCSTPSGSPHTFLINNPSTAQGVTLRTLTCRANGTHFTADINLGYMVSAQ
jgi:hypothetical protein